MGEIISVLFKGKNEKKVINKLRIYRSLFLINDRNARINVEVIEIKKEIKIHFEFIDGNPEDFPEDLTFEGKVDVFSEKFTFEGKNSYVHKVDGYHFLLDKLEGGLNDDGELKFKEKVFIPYTSIKMVREKYEYYVEEQDVYELIKRESRNKAGITDANLKDTLLGKGVKLSEECLEGFLKELEDEKRILRDNNLWFTKEFSDREPREELLDEIRENQPQARDEGKYCRRSIR